MTGMGGCLDDRAVARFAGGESSADEAKVIRAHLELCPACRAKLAHAAQQLDQDSPTESPSEIGRRWRDVVTGPEERGLRPAAPLERGAQVGRYLILGKLGEGGMGVVYAAFDPELDRKVALKLLRAGKKKATSGSDGHMRLLREAQAMARVSHPNVVAVYDGGSLDDRVFVAMELVTGSTLRQWLQASPRTPREVLEMFRAAGAGLAAAHAAGIAHRDFKPENVLVGKDERPRVTDFGLARRVGAEDEPVDDSILLSAEEHAARLSSPLTQEGAVMGTPHYMSPEQHLGRPADARSDQFSFCAALYWALYRKRAFEPKKLAAAARELDQPPGAEPKAPVVQEPPREPKVPARVRRALVRGLSMRAEDRFPTMEALLGQLAPEQVRRRVSLYAGVALAVVIATGVVTSQLVAQRRLLCSGAEDRLAGIWDAPTRARIQTSLLGTRIPYAAATWAEVQLLLDRYSGAWVEMRTDACRATRIRGEQTEQVLSLRMVCLDRRLKDVQALTQLLETADAKTVEKAVDAAQALPGLKRCEDVEALLANTRAPLSEDPAVRAEVERLAGLLAQGRALQGMGKFKQGLEVARTASTGTATLRDPALHAEALELVGWLTAMSGDPKTGEQRLVDALVHAEAGRDDDRKVRVSTRLVYVVGNLEGRADEGHRWARLSGAALERLGGSDELEIDLQASHGAAYLLEGKAKEAEEAYERALLLVDRALGADSPKRALILTSLGVIYERRGDLPRAEKTLKASIASIEQARGPGHPSAAYAHNSIASVYRDQKKYPEALSHVETAIRIWEASLGKDHFTVGDAQDNLATILQEQGRYEEALQRFERGLEIKQKALGRDDPNLSYSYDGIGHVYLRMGKAKEAIPYLERALFLRKDDPENLAETRFGLAQALYVTRRDVERARRLAGEAKTTYLTSGNAAEAARVERWLAANR